MNDLQQLQTVAVGELLRYFEADEQPEDGFARAKLALGSLSAVARLKATSRAADTLQFHVVSAFAENEEQLKEYIEISLPHLVPAALLSQ